MQHAPCAARSPVKHSLLCLDPQQTWLRSGEWITAEARPRRNSPSFNPYDGPDDPDRYQGHGEWDRGAGFWCGD